MRSKRGITLVSLVVTIIVLIILAGVSINLTLGENGIITMAKRARENMELAKADEERQLNELFEQIVTEGGFSGNPSDDAIIRLAEFKREIASTITDMGIETAENADASTMSSNIRKILEIATADKVSYDNTNSGLTATNVQGAVDELDSEMDDLNDSLGNIEENLNKSMLMINTADVITSNIDLSTPWTAPRDCFISGGFTKASGGGNGICIDGVRCINFSQLLNNDSDVSPVSPFFIKANTVISKATNFGTFLISAYGCK